MCAGKLYMFFYEKHTLLASLHVTVYPQKKMEKRKTTDFKLRVLLKGCTVAIFDACIIIGAR